MAWRGLICSAPTRQWGTRLEDVNREVGQLGDALCRGVERVGVRARCFILRDSSYAFNTVSRTTMLAEVATYLPAFTPFVAKCYGERDVFFWIDSGEHRAITCPRGMKQGDPMEPVILCLLCSFGSFQQ